jgi:hypothetical protein
MCDWEGYTTGTTGLPNPNQRRRENVRVPASLIYTGIPCRRSSGRDSLVSITEQPIFDRLAPILTKLCMETEGVVPRNTEAAGLAFTA